MAKRDKKRGEKRREKNRRERAAESKSIAEMNRNDNEEYKARIAEGEGGNITDFDIVNPPIEVEIVKDKSDRPVVNYKTPTDTNPSKVNDADVLTRRGIGKGDDWFLPARFHANRVPPENMERTDDKLMILPNKLVSEQTRTKCDLRMYGKGNHSLHDKWYNGVGAKNTIKFHMRHWKNCWGDDDGDEIYLYTYFSTNNIYDSSFQCRLKGGGISQSCALLSGSIIMGEPCAVIKATLGKDRQTLSDTTFKFIRINRDMDTVVDLPLGDDSLIVTPYEITTKGNEEINDGAVAWDASRGESVDDNDLAEEEEWE